MLVKYHSSDNIKASFEDFALGLQNTWTGPNLVQLFSILVSGCFGYKETKEYFSKYNQILSKT